ncbi:hypothetical protein SSX86_011472 [Deinandra increscens subsp. villosa]|uniref:RRM domain-containing protein n=1 Tax=Deinandra increscens subsp. villosa TaxID=3103831 RepID=A0AAP0GZY0_9ASTR
MERRKPIPENIQRRISKIFVSNLPNGCSGNDLAALVRPFGQIFDIYIARKRDKGGNRFGFISFLDVKDKDDLIRELRNTRLGDYKLWFNIARFVLEDGEVNIHRDVRPAKVDYGKRGSTAGEGTKEANSSEVGSWSFKDMLVGKTITINSDGNGLGTLHGLAVVVRMLDFSSLKNIKIILNELAFKEERIQYLGGLDLLITFSSRELADSFKDKASMAKERFSLVVIWEGQVLGFERLAWLKIQGIPLHILSNDVIDLIGGMFGRIVHKASRSDLDVDLSFEYLGVLLGDGKRVAEEIMLNWKERKFRVWVTEDNEDWVPEFLEPTVMGTSKVMEDVEDVNVSSPEVNPIEEEEEVDAAIEPELVETEGTHNFRNNNATSLLNNEGVYVMEGINEHSIPREDLPFEKDCEINEVETANVINKRKKFKKADVGRPSPCYTSSQESLKITKRAKNVDDLFEIDRLLGLTDSQLDRVGSGPVINEVGVDHSNFNSTSSLVGPVPSQNVEPVFSAPENCQEGVQRQRVEGNMENFSEDRSILQHQEVLKTIFLGTNLGADFTNSDDIIREAVRQEGLQSGKS